jgi:hypothetical protein
VQLSAFADLESAVWDVAIDGRWLGAGPGESAVVTFTPFDADSVGSARLVAVWLSSGETYSLAALRPTHAKGQDRDAISVSLPQTQEALSVFDPRLSTEYSADGVPQRFGVELWLGEDPEGDQRPLRLAGEAQGETAALTQGPVSVHPMRAHSAGVSGLGIYVLVQ